MNIIIFDVPENLVNCYGEAAEKLGMTPIFFSKQMFQLETSYTIIYKDITTEYEAVKRFITENIVDVGALISLDDRSVIEVNMLSNELGIYLNDEESIVLNRDKSAMKLLWGRVGISTSKAKILNKIQDVDVAPLSYPLIIKPAMGFASSGVVKIKSDKELDEYIKLLNVANSMYYDKSHMREKSIIIEEFIDGDEYAVDSLWKDGRAIAHFISSKDNPQGPLFKDHMYIADPNIEDYVKEELIATAINVGEASNYRTGATHIEMRINTNGCFVIESACRPGGGGELYKIFTEACNIDVFELFLSLYVDNKKELESIDVTPQKLTMMYIVQQSSAGRISNIKGLPEVLRLPEVFDYYLIKKNGERLMREDINLEYIAFIFMSYSEKEMNKVGAIEKAKEYDNCIEVVCA